MATQSAPGSRSARKQETRRALLDAAARLFAANGFHNTSVPDIVREAGVGHGTFYEHFGNRRDILLALTLRAGADAGRRPRLQSDDLAERIRSEIFWFLADFVEHLELSKVWHEAASFDPEIAEDRRRGRAVFVGRVCKGIEAAGVPPGVDPRVAAAALTAMLEELAHRWFVEGDGPDASAREVVAVGETVSTLWLASLGLDRRS